MSDRGYSARNIVEPVGAHRVFESNTAVKSAPTQREVIPYTAGFHTLRTPQTNSGPFSEADKGKGD